VQREGRRPKPRGSGIGLFFSLFLPSLNDLHSLQPSQKLCERDGVRRTRRVARRPLGTQQSARRLAAAPHAPDREVTALRWCCRCQCCRRRRRRHRRRRHAATRRSTLQPPRDSCQDTIAYSAGKGPSYNAQARSATPDTNRIEGRAIHTVISKGVCATAVPARRQPHLL